MSKTADPEAAVVRAKRCVPNGKPEWLAIIAEPENIAGKIEPQPSLDALISAVEYQLAAEGFRGPAQITVFFDA